MVARSPPSSIWAEPMLGVHPEATVATKMPAAVPAVASLALASRLCAEPRPAIVLGVSTGFAWCEFEDHVVLLASPGAVRFPNAILAAGGWDTLEPGDRIEIGSNAVLGGRLDWRVVRWWDPRPPTVKAERSAVFAQVASVARQAAPHELAIEGALAACDQDGVIGAALGMLGAGGGLTPDADDVLIGALATYRHVAASLGHPEGEAFIDDVADQLLWLAQRRTTLLSATLLRHACAGEVPDPLADLMLAVTGLGNASVALERCFALGGSSGRAMACGVVAGGRAACRVSS